MKKQARNIVQSDFEKNVDAIEKNTYNSDNEVIMGVTPDVLQKIGLTPLPIAITKNHIYSIAVSEARAKKEGRYRKNTNYHNLGFNAVKDIYNKISNPLMVIAHPDFTNKARRDSAHKIIVLVDLSINNKQVIAPISIDFEGVYNNTLIDVNLVATYFDKNNINDLIKEAVALENNNQTGFFYIDKKRTQSIFKKSGYQLPSQLNNLSSNIIIRKIDNNVNRKIEKITQSQQFLRWFGDWQNAPEKASKAVDNNGEPLVLYHQTAKDFSTFDTKQKGAGEFDSEMPTGIFMKPTKNDIGVGGNIQMPLYASIKNPLTVNNRSELVDFYNENVQGYKEAKDTVRKIDNEYKTKFQEETKKENEEYQKLWNARKNGEITEAEYQKAISRDPLDEILEEWHDKVNEASLRAKNLIDKYFDNSKYDGLIVNNDVGSFGRSTKTYVAFKNTQIKSATDNIGTFNPNNPDIRYQSRSSNSDYDFSKALNKKEWASFYSSLQKSNQREAFRVGDNGILIPDEKSSNDYKLVCYEGDSTNPHIIAIYKLENYDYNIHDGNLNILQTIIDRKKGGLNEKHTEAILCGCSTLSGTIFREYNGKTYILVEFSRKYNKTLQHNSVKSDRAGVSENTGQRVSDSRVNDNVDTSAALEESLQESDDYSKLFQMRYDDGFANRRLLANALEKSARNNYEKNKVKLYKENIDLIDEYEARLDEVNKKISNIISVKANERTREQRTELNKLNNVKKILEDKIVRKDRQLLNLESMEPMKKLIDYEKEHNEQKNANDFIFLIDIFCSLY